jgi:hypothetical protein
VEETGENYLPSASHSITQCCIEYTSPWAWFELTTLVVIGTDCIGSCKSNYHTTTTAPLQDVDTNKLVREKVFTVMIPIYIGL